MSDAGQADFRLKIQVESDAARAKLAELKAELQKAQDESKNYTGGDEAIQRAKDQRVADAQKEVSRQAHAVEKAEAAQARAEERAAEQADADAHRIFRAQNMDLARAARRQLKEENKADRDAAAAELRAERAAKAAARAEALAAEKAVKYAEKEIASHAHDAANAVRNLGAGFREIETLSGAGGGPQGLFRAVARLGPEAAVAAAALGGLVAASKLYIDQQQRYLDIETELALRGKDNLANLEAYRAALAKIREESGANFSGPAAALAKEGIGGDQVGALLENIRSAEVVTKDLDKATNLVIKTLKGSSQAWHEYGIEIDSLLPATEQYFELQKKLAVAHEIAQEKTETLAGEFNLFKGDLATMANIFGHVESAGFKFGARFAPLFQQLNEFRLLLHQMATDAEELANRWVPGFKKILDVTGEVGKSTVDLATAVKNLADEEYRAKKAAAETTEELDQQAKADQALITAEGELAAAKKKHALADVEAAVSRGRKTKEQGDLEKAAIEGASEKTQFELAQKADQARIEALSRDVTAIRAQEVAARHRLELFEKEHGKSIETERSIAGPFNEGGPERIRSEKDVAEMVALRRRQFDRAAAFRESSAASSEERATAADKASHELFLKSLQDEIDHTVDAARKAALQRFLEDQKRNAPGSLGAHEQFQNLFPSLTGLDQQLRDALFARSQAAPAGQFAATRAAGAAAADELGEEANLAQQLHAARAALLTSQRHVAEAAKEILDSAAEQRKYAQQIREANRATAATLSKSTEAIETHKQELKTISSRLDAARSSPNGFQ